MNYQYTNQVVAILQNESNLEGRELRKRLNQDKWFWQKWSAISFYKFMATLEDAGIITYDIKQKFITDNNNTLLAVNKTRFYKLAQPPNLNGQTVKFDQNKTGLVLYQEGHKLYINYTVNNNNIQTIRFLHEVELQ